MSFADFLVSYRNKNSLSKRKFAEICNLSHTEIGRLERGKNPSIDTIEKIANGINISKEQLLYLAGYLDTDILESKKDLKAFIAKDPELLDFLVKLSEKDDLQLLLKQSKDMNHEEVKRVIKVIKEIKNEL